MDMRRNRLLIGAAAFLASALTLSTIAASTARADDDDWHNGDRDAWRYRGGDRDGWRDRDNDWRYNRGGGPYYAPRPYVYGPTYRYYAPPRPAFFPPMGPRVIISR